MTKEMKKRSESMQMPLMLSSRGLKKRGQVTIFIIIAIIIVGVLLSFFLWIGPTYLSEKSKALDFEICIEDVVEESIEELAIAGGDINSEFYYKYNGYHIPYLCYSDEYYRPCVVQKPFLTTYFGEALERSTRVSVELCYDNSIDELKAEGYEVIRGDVEYSISFDPQTIIAELEAPTIIGGSKFQKISATVRSPIYDMLMIATSILQYETSYGDSDISTLMFYYPDMAIEKIKRGDGTTIYIIEDKQSKLKFQFASRSYAWPPGYGIN